VTALSESDLQAAFNLELLGLRVQKTGAATGGAGEAIRSLTFGKAKAKRAQLRRERPPAAGEEWDLAKFEPELGATVRALVEGKLSATDFPALAESAAAPVAAAGGASAAASAGKSMRTNWASKKPKAGAAAAPKPADKAAGAGAADEATGGRRLVVFVLGGVTRSEVRCVHELAALTGRDVLLGSTNLLTPDSFLDQLRELHRSAAPDALHIDIA